MSKIIRGFLILLLLFLLIPPGLEAADKMDLPKLIIFHSLSCHRCFEVKHDLMPEIENEFRGKVAFEYLDVGNIESYKMLIGLLQRSGMDISTQVPLFYFQGEFLFADGQLKENLRSFIFSGLKKNYPGIVPGAVDLVLYFKSFVPAAIIFAGLGDGINPCAFTVIVFFISFLALQGYRKKELIIIGGTFILAVFLTYLCIGLGIFNFFYRFQGFWIVTQSLNLIIGTMSILFGVFAVYDFIEFRKTGSTEGLLLQLPKPVKERIHKVVGFFYRKNLQQKAEKSKPGPAKLIFSALATGFLVSLLEAICTGQMYLPTISFVLKSTRFKFQALGYLFLYNIMFVVPLMVIFVFALFGTTSAQFSGFLKKHIELIKILMAILFFSLGAYLILAA